VKAFNAACRAGDVEQAIALAYAPTEMDRESLRSMVAVGSATERLRTAVAEHFGPDADYEVDFGLPRDEEFDDAVERIAGGGREARVVMAAWKNAAPTEADAVGTTRLIRRDRRWLIDARLRGADGDEHRRGILLNRLFARSADLTMKDVKAGKFSEPNEVAGAFRARPFGDHEAFRDLLPLELLEELDSADDD
jgi:hypothetical protein